MLFFFCKIELAEAKLTSIIKNATKIKENYITTANIFIQVNNEPIVVDVTTSTITKYIRCKAVLQMILFQTKKVQIFSKSATSEILLQISRISSAEEMPDLHLDIELLEDFDVFFSKFFKEVVIWNSVRKV